MSQVYSLPSHVRSGAAQHNSWYPGQETVEAVDVMKMDEDLSLSTGDDTSYRNVECLSEPESITRLIRFTLHGEVGSTA